MNDDGPQRTWMDVARREIPGSVVRLTFRGEAGKATPRDDPWFSRSLSARVTEDINIDGG